MQMCTMYAKVDMYATVPDKVLDMTCLATCV